MSWISNINLNELNRTFQNYSNIMAPIPALKNKPELNKEKVKCIENFSIEKLKDYAFEALERYQAVWDYDNFWKRANTCDSCISLTDCLITYHSNDSEVKEFCIKLQNILMTNLDYFKKTNHDDQWMDDFGWWGLMAINAHKLLKKIGNEGLALDYLKLSETCWNFMIKHAYDNTSEAQPVANGCRNNSAGSPDEGVKNTVVNALLLLLSTRLYQIFGEEKRGNPESFIDLAYHQWIWFSNWFELKDYQYLKSFEGDENAALVGERPLAYFTGSDYQNIAHPDWTANWVWSGDQGILIGGLLDLMNLKDKLKESCARIYPERKFDENDFEIKVKDTLHKLVLGVKKGMVGKEDNLFYEPPCDSSFCSNYANDYYEGRGILVRYIDIQKVKSLFNEDFLPPIVETLKALWKKKDSDTNQYQIEYTDEKNKEDYVNQFNSLWNTKFAVTNWDLSSVDEKLKNELTQALGLDFLAATMRSI